MPCECGYADECDGEHATFHPLQDGGMCSVSPCRKPKPLPVRHYTEPIDEERVRQIVHQELVRSGLIVERSRWD